MQHFFQDFNNSNDQPIKKIIIFATQYNFNLILCLRRFLDSILQR